MSVYPVTEMAVTVEESVAVTVTVTGSVTNHPFDPSAVGKVTFTSGAVMSDGGEVTVRVSELGELAVLYPLLPVSLVFNCVLK